MKLTVFAVKMFCRFHWIIQEDTIAYNIRKISLRMRMHCISVFKLYVKIQNLNKELKTVIELNTFTVKCSFHWITQDDVVVWTILYMMSDFLLRMRKPCNRLNVLFILFFFYFIIYLFYYLFILLFIYSLLNVGRLQHIL